MFISTEMQLREQKAKEWDNPVAHLMNLLNDVEDAKELS